MQNYGLTTVSEYLGDRIVYRNLVPADRRLPALSDIHDQIGLPAGQIPRKIDPPYAQAIVYFLQQARHLDGVQRPLRRLVFIGDTRLLDGTAFTHISLAGGWPGRAFIGSETNQPAEAHVVPDPAGALYLANRWVALADFDEHCAAQGLAIDEDTAVVIDLDKTAVGARGRNASIIDQARQQAVEVTVAGLLGPAYDAARFRHAYETLNPPEFHPFTADNQDYLAYICLVLGSGLIGLEALVALVRSGVMSSFQQFIYEVDKRTDELPPALASVHHDILANVRRGDPTPFKSFRRNEYLETVGRMGCLPDEASLQRLLAEEILITQEVRQWALTWLSRGALLFGLSDKPDEASTPTPEQAQRGLQPIHRTPTHAVGPEI
jgi:hypothetical protein